MYKEGRKAVKSQILQGQYRCQPSVSQDGGETQTAKYTAMASTGWGGAGGAGRGRAGLTPSRPPATKGLASTRGGMVEEID